MNPLGPVLFVGFLFFNPVSGQQSAHPVSDNLIQSRMEAMLEQGGSETDVSGMFETLENFRNHPLDLNHAVEEDLKALPFLPEHLISPILLHKVRFGKFLELEELQVIPGFSKDLLDLLIPFVRVNPDDEPQPFKPSKIFTESHQSFLVRYQRVLQNQSGYMERTENGSVNSAYLGSPDKIFARYRFKYRNAISAGITLEKDPGETFFPLKSANRTRLDPLRDSLLNHYGLYKKGFDFWSGNIAWQGRGLIRSAVVGDFEFRSGQGLVLWTGPGFGKTADAILLRRYGTGIKPYSSVNEDGFFRGISVGFGWKVFNLDLFYSDRKISGNRVFFNEDSLPELSSVGSSGFSRLPLELDDRQVTRLNAKGARASMGFKSFKFGFTGLQYEFGIPVAWSAEPYKKFDFQGTKGLNLGMDAGMVFRNFNLFGEVGSSLNGGKALLAGTTVFIHRDLSVSWLYRNYNKNYHTLYASALSESSTPKNETGFFTGFNLKLLRQITFSGYADFFSFPYLKFGVDFPSKGEDYLVQLNYQPSRKIDLYLRFSERIKQENFLEPGSRFPELTPSTRRKCRFHAGYAISPVVSFASRVEWVESVSLKSQSSVGWLFYQDLEVKPFNFPVSAKLRIAWFDTDDFNSAVYAYEDDVLYAYSMTSHYHQGLRYNVVVRVDLIRKLDVWIKYGLTIQTNQGSIGSGLDEIDGNQRSEIKIQVRWRINQ